MSARRASASRVARQQLVVAARSFHCFATASGSYSIVLGKYGAACRTMSSIVRARTLSRSSSARYHVARAVELALASRARRRRARGVTSGASSAAAMQARDAGRSSTRASSCRRSRPSSDSPSGENSSIICGTVITSMSSPGRPAEQREEVEHRAAAGCPCADSRRPRSRRAAC